MFETPHEMVPSVFLQYFFFPYRDVVMKQKTRKHTVDNVINST